MSIKIFTTGNAIVEMCPELQPQLIHKCVIFRVVVDFFVVIVQPTDRENILQLSFVHLNFPSPVAR